MPPHTKQPPRTPNPKPKAKRLGTPKAEEYQKRPGTLAWFYLGTFESYITVAEAFITAPPDDNLISNIQKETFRLAWEQLPMSHSDAIKLHQEDPTYDHELFKLSPAILDFLCEQLRIPPKRFYQYVEGYLLEIIQDRAYHIKKLRVGQLYEKSLEYGMKESGFKDRNAILQNEGFHYAPKGSTISINNDNRTVNVERGLPSFENTVHTLSGILVEDEEDNQLQLGPAPFTMEANNEPTSQLDLPLDGTTQSG